MKNNASQSQKNSRAIANQIVQKKSGGKSLQSAAPIQMMEEEEPLQGKFKSGIQESSGEIVQKMAGEDEEMPMQG